MSVVARPRTPEAPASAPALRPARGPRSVPFVTDLATHGDAPALVTAGGIRTHAALAQAVADAAAALPDVATGRRLVLLELGNDETSLVAHLATLAAGHVALITSPTHASTDSLVGRYAPDLVVPHGTPLPAAARAAAIADQPARHDLHPELAVLLSTSGSTGSPKLVRLSHDNLQSNAEAIAQALGLRADDRAITSLPAHYCYGLSVLHSHLAVGASVVLTGASVVDPCFWDAARTHSVTSLAGVPHTFEMLERIAGATASLPSLRRITQAGGRMAPRRVAEVAERGRREGWDLVVMYGQTEATARMAILPPELLPGAEDSVGRAVPGSRLTLDHGVPEAVDLGPDVGELLLEGPGVMLGYARSPRDLALGRTTHVLRTGDLARIDEDGLVRIIGRRRAFLKVLGTRIDLGEVEARLEERGLSACAGGTDETLDVAVAIGPQLSCTTALRATVADAAGLPAAAVRTVVLDELPRLSTGKVDRPAAMAAVAAAAEAAQASQGQATTEAATDQIAARLAALRETYALCLDLPDVTPEDTFSSLGGDSLSYVEVSLRVEELLGDLPADWHHRSLADLAASAVESPSRLAAVEGTVALRAAATVAVALAHVDVVEIRGGAHALLAVAGYNLARFSLSAPTGRERLRRTFGSVAAVAVPAVLWMTLVTLVNGTYDLANLGLVNWLVGDVEWGARVHAWFIEALVWCSLGTAALLAIPGVGRLHRRAPFALALGLAVVALVPRFVFLTDTSTPVRGLPYFVAWLFLLGVAAAGARGHGQRALILAVAALGIHGYYGDLIREATILAGVAALLWLPRVRMPRPVAAATALIASSSLFIYLCQWQVFGLFDEKRGLAAFVAAMAVGIAVHLGWTQFVRLVRHRTKVTKVTPTPIKEHH
ncbi:AMP-binding protein [Janibacter sp. G56]|uniref:AMP-binding protein n=1 Tax=Janibacter sp. G56 TaxID=3418717 RepID=UPI003D076AE3